MVVAKRSGQGGLDHQVVESVVLGRDFDVAEVGFLLIVTLREVLKVAAWVVGWVCCWAEE